MASVPSILMWLARLTFERRCQIRMFSPANTDATDGSVFGVESSIALVRHAGWLFSTILAGGLIYHHTHQTKRRLSPETDKLHTTRASHGQGSGPHCSRGGIDGSTRPGNYSPPWYPREECRRWKPHAYILLWKLWVDPCLLYTSPSPRDVEESRMPSSA